MKPELRLEQKQIITPQLLLNLKILALPNLELETLIRTELEQNPALELTSDANEALNTETETPLENESELPVNENSEEFNVADYISDDSSVYPSETGVTFEMPENNSPARTSLETNLFNAVKPYLTENVYIVAEYIIGNLDDEGFLNIPAQEIAQKFNIALRETEEIIRAIQQIEPGGIGAENLQQALLIQLHILNYAETSLEIIIIRDYYQFFINRDLNQIAKALSVSENEISQAITNLKELEPRPIRRYLSDIASYINPDFSITWQNENLNASINDETFPVLKISKRYREILQQPQHFSREEVSFARIKIQSAINLIKAIDSRKNLLYRILNFIITNQREFLTNGKENIKPIPIKTVAEAMNVHISTISRACQGKYIETPVGIFPVKFFFSTGIGDFSRDSLKEKIRQFIELENKAKPLTDDEIVTLLAQQNIKLSRRTVAKYREELNILNSNDRIEKLIN